MGRDMFLGFGLMLGPLGADWRANLIGCDVLNFASLSHSETHTLITSSRRR